MVNARRWWHCCSCCSYEGNWSMKGMTKIRNICSEKTKTADTIITCSHCRAALGSAHLLTSSSLSASQAAICHLSSSQALDELLKLGSVNLWAEQSIPAVFEPSRCLCSAYLERCSRRCLSFGSFSVELSLNAQIWHQAASRLVCSPGCYKFSTQKKMWAS